jgi:ribosomal protein S27E
MPDAVEVRCPHCAAPTVFFLDPSEGARQELIEDCQVCCRPILFRVTWSRGRARVEPEALDA